MSWRGVGTRRAPAGPLLERDENTQRKDLTMTNCQNRISWRTLSLGAALIGSLLASHPTAAQPSAHRGTRDRDRDGVIDARDRDRDGDGIRNARDRHPNVPDRTTTSGARRPAWTPYRTDDRDRWRSSQDRDRDGISDARDWDRDGDGIANARDPHPNTPDQRTGTGTYRDRVRTSRDTDRDGVRNARDWDRDGDGVANARDRYPDDRRRR